MPNATRTSACPLDCPDACSLEVDVADGKVRSITGGAHDPLTAGFICNKVRHFERRLYGDGRLTHPARRVGAKGAGRFEPIGWEEALSTVAARLAAVRARAGGGAILPYGYGGSNGYLSHGSADARLFSRLGACAVEATICAAPTTSALRAMYGGMPGTPLTEYDQARLIVVWGHNPEATSIHLLQRIQRARRRGAQLIVIDPRRTRLAARADLHLQPRPGTDLPLALSAIRWLFHSGRAADTFLAAHTDNVDRLRERAEPWSFAAAAAVTGIGAATLRGFASRYAEASPAVIRCGWGLERNRNGGSAAAAIFALPAVAGKLGVRGGGFTASNSGAWRIDKAAATGVAEAEPGRRVVNMNQLGTALTGSPPVQLLFVYDGNPLMTAPDQHRVRRGLGREDLFCVVFEQVMTDTARYADILLPATTFLEHAEVGRSYGALALHATTAAVAPVGEARSNFDVFTDLARRLGLLGAGDPTSELAQRDAWLAHAHVARGLGNQPPPRDQIDRCGVARPWTEPGPVPFVDRLPPTPTGRIDLCPAALDAESPVGLYRYQDDPGGERFPIALISPASEQTVSSTLGELRRRQVPVRLATADATARGIAAGDRVRLHNSLGEVRCVAAIDATLPAGVAVLPKGLWSHNTLDGNTSNALVPETLTDLGRGACFNDARIAIERIDGGNREPGAAPAVETS